MQQVLASIYVFFANLLCHPCLISLARHLDLIYLIYPSLSQSTLFLNSDTLDSWILPAVFHSHYIIILFQSALFHPFPQSQLNPWHLLNSLILQSIIFCHSTHGSQVPVSNFTYVYITNFLHSSPIFHSHTELMSQLLLHPSLLPIAIF